MNQTESRTQNISIHNQQAARQGDEEVVWRGPGISGCMRVEGIERLFPIDRNGLGLPNVK